MQLLGKEGYHSGSQDRGYEVPALRHEKFDLMILDLGSNDLDPTRHPNPDLDRLASLYG